MANQPSDAGARREMERLVWAAAFAHQLHAGWSTYEEKKGTQLAAEWADIAARAYREHGPTR